ncbi:MAG: hypothetical protein ABF264_02530 [Flavobacteriales bacterium]
MQETKDNKEIEQKDKTNWQAWYWSLMIFLGVQIAIYYFITNLYTA